MAMAFVACGVVEPVQPSTVVLTVTVTTGGVGSSFTLTESGAPAAASGYPIDLAQPDSSDSVCGFVGSGGGSFGGSGRSGSGGSSADFAIRCSSMPIGTYVFTARVDTAGGQV
ncbi:MAG TPA: hypothetical protein VMH39_02875, partial [Gemmatimonadaceae bacterium]|nr:hypothetical protein [Gemmatimonadaceae bacterium]